MKKQNLLFRISSICLLTVIIFIGLTPLKAYAADLSISLSVTKSAVLPDESFSAGVLLDAQEQIGTYYVEIEYDAERLEYVSGADSGENGSLILTGTGLYNRITYNLIFKAIKPGKAGIRIRTAKANESGGQNSPEFTVKTSSMTEISVTGTDSGISFSDKIKDEDLALASGLPVIGEIASEGVGTLYVVDHSSYIPEDAGWYYRKTDDTFSGQTMTFLSDERENVHILYLMDKNGIFYPYAFSEERMYPVADLTNADGEQYLLISPSACTTVPEKLIGSSDLNTNIVYAIDSDGKGTFSYMSSKDDTLIAWDEIAKSSSNTSMRNLLIIGCIIVVCIAALVIILVIILKAIRRSRR